MAFFRDRYDIPKSIGMRFPRRGETVDNPPKGHVAFYEKMFEFGVRFPLHPFAQESLAEVNIAPAQLAPNGWDILLGCWMLWWGLEVDVASADYLTLSQFLSFYTVKNLPKKPGRFYLTARQGVGKLVKGPCSIKH